MHLPPPQASVPSAARDLPVVRTTPLEFVQHVMLAEDSHLFELWLAVGGVLAAPIFASTAIAMPLLLDHRVSLMSAVLTSWHAYRDLVEASTLPEQESN